MSGSTNDQPTNPEPKVTATAWLAAFANELGVDAPDDQTVETLLEMAGVAAHASERIAAPIACYLIGAKGVSPAEGLALAKATV